MIFDKNNTTYEIIDSNKSEINVIGKVAYYETGNDYLTYDVTPIKIVKSNDKWIIYSYSNIYTGMVSICSIEYYLNDIIINNKSNSKHKISVEYYGKTYSTDDEIKSIVNFVEGVYTTPNGEKWIEPHIIYDEKGYVFKVNL